MTDRRSLTMADTQMGTSGPAVGIDLGTTNSCVAVRQKGSIQIIPNDQGNRTTPSFVAFTKYERLIGDGAKNQAVSNFSNTIFDAKRLIGRRFSEETVQKDMKQWPFTVVAGEKDNPMIRVTYKDQDMHFTPEEISSMVLIKMKEIAETYLGCPVKNAVVTVPAYFNDSQRRATKDAGQIAGLNVLQIINEPTAAALAYGLNEPNNQGHNRKPKHVFVFDFGGGTLDVCALEIKSGVIHVMAVNGDTHLGGQDIDSIMVDHFVKEFQRKNDEDMKKNVRAVSRLRAACERAKRTLSAAIRAEIELDSLYGGIDFKGNITRAKFEDLLEELFERCMVPVEKCLKDAGLTKGDIHEVLIVGGSTRIPKVQSMLKEFFAGKNLCSSIHAEEAVAYGAAVQAAALDGQSNEKGNDFVLVDVAPLSLGMKVAGDIVVPVIKRNTAIPCKEEKTFPTSVNYQKGMTFHVYEGERSMASDNNLLGVFALDGLEPKLAGEVTVLVTFQIDENGILNVSARDYDTGRVANVTITNEKGRLTGEQIDAMIKAATKYRLEDEDRKKAALAKLELEDLLYKLKKFMSNKELVSSLEEAKKQSLKTSIDDTLEWSEKNEHEADVHQFRSKKKRVENIWKSTVGATLHWSCFAASLAMDFMS